MKMWKLIIIVMPIASLMVLLIGYGFVHSYNSWYALCLIGNFFAGYLVADWVILKFKKVPELRDKCFRQQVESFLITTNSTRLLIVNAKGTA